MIVEKERGDFSWRTEACTGYFFYPQVIIA